jgi:cytochrome c oxidase cbb3-type subunit III
MSKINNEPKLDIKPDEEHLLLDHNYDGIQELNHPLPKWWNVIFYVSCFFSIIYFAYYHMMSGPSLRDEFKKSHAQIIATQAEFKRLNSAFNEEMYNSIIADDGVKKGEIVYETNCLACHNEKGKGDIGPNLTDKYWLVANGQPDTIYNVVFNGSEENGMPAWAELIPKEEIYQAVAYVMSLKNTHQVGGKEPQGEMFEE